MKDIELFFLTRNCNGTFRKGWSSYLVIAMQLQGHVLSIKTDLTKLKKEPTCSCLFCEKLMFSYLKVMELCSWGWKLDVPSQPKPFNDSIMMKFCSSSSNLWFSGHLEAKSQFHFWHKCTCKPQRIIEALGEILHLTAQNPTTRYKAELGWCLWYSSETLIKLGTAMEQGKAIKAPKCRQE